MASEYSADGKVESLEGAVLAKRFHGILATSGCEPACWWCKWRYACLVKAYGQDQYIAEKSEYWIHGGMYLFLC
jgi:hypothetical protein